MNDTPPNLVASFSAHPTIPTGATNVAIPEGGRAGTKQANENLGHAQKKTTFNRVTSLKMFPTRLGELQQLIGLKALCHARL
jgi:hypothetical protein